MLPGNLVFLMTRLLQQHKGRLLRRWARSMSGEMADFTMHSPVPGNTQPIQAGASCLVVHGCLLAGAAVEIQLDVTLKVSKRGHWVASGYQKASVTTTTAICLISPQSVAPDPGSPTPLGALHARLQRVSVGSRDRCCLLRPAPL
jgi:hypothetical protein